MFIRLFLIILFFSLPLQAHTFTGMIGFYDGLSHPVLGLDHFLAMVSVGIVSAQIGGRAIWTLPSTFVCIMIVGGTLGMIAEIRGINENNSLDETVFIIVEFGIILSVILLGLAIAVEKKLPTTVTMIFVGFFGLCHGGAHGLEMPWANNPILFALGFASGTTILHLFGVGIGILANKSISSSILLRLVGVLFAVYGIYLLFL